MTTSEIIALGALLVSLAALLIKGRRDSHGDVAGNAARDARVDAKLDGIASGVNDMRVEVRTMRENQNEHAKQLAVLESSVKSAHHRIDRIEQKGGSQE